VILFENVTKQYFKDAAPALDNVSVNVEAGEFAFLVGASGSGKSTFLNLVLRLEVANQGRIIVAGNDLATIAKRRIPKYRQGLGVVFQDFKLLPKKTVFENVAFKLQMIGMSNTRMRPLVAEALEVVGLEGKEQRLPHELSGGEQQRVALARAFVNQPPIILADEPTGNLDPTTSEGIMSVIENINRRGALVLMATHDQQIVNRSMRRVIELSEGRIIRDQIGKYEGARVPETQVPGLEAEIPR
jgi:cell division transport system ATP-binding protein